MPKKVSYGSLFKALRYILPYKLIALGAFASLTLGSLMNLAIPKVQQFAIDKGIMAKELRAVIIGAVLIVAFAIVRAVLTFLEGYLAAKASQGVAFDLRNDLYQKVQHLSFSYHDKAQTGQLLTRATSDVELVRQFIGMGVIQLLNGIIMMAGSLVLLFGINWRLTLMTLPVMGLVIVVFTIFARYGRPLFVLVQQKLALVNVRLQEAITGVRVVKAFTQEPFEIDRYGRTNRDLLDISLRARRIFAVTRPLIMVIANLSTVVIVWAGGYQVFAEWLSIGELVAFQSYLMLTMFPMIMLGSMMMTVAQASAGAERIMEILDAVSEVQEKPDARELPRVEGHLRFENVSFRYFAESDPVLKGVSFEAEPGETIALLGATGSGKSTVINLIPRFYDVTKGRITLDGEDIRDVTLESLRRQIGIVLQEVILFGGTIRENIAYGRTGATDEEIEEVARVAEAHEFITSYPKGYETEVGERGVTLSGGQKQRVAIARALLIDPRVLILDDSTSSVDFATEMRIQQAMERLRKGRLCFVIAQRISTVKTADKIIVLDRGEMAAMGTHEKLLSESPLYADIYYSQLQPEKGGDGPGASAAGAPSDRSGRGRPTGGSPGGRERGPK